MVLGRDICIPGHEFEDEWIWGAQGRGGGIEEGEKERKDINTALRNLN